jgi:hypothetical protein
MQTNDLTEVGRREQQGLHLGFTFSLQGTSKSGNESALFVAPYNY